MTSTDTIKVSTDGPVMTLMINRPEVLNALDPPSHLALHHAFDRYATDDALRVAVITGAGEKAFCVGSDLKVRSAMGSDDMPPTGFGGITERFDLFKPVIAAVNGHAIGGGLEVVLACDLAIASSGAKFGLPETKIGLAAAGGLHRLARQIPLKHAMEIALTAELFPATKALDYGLINAVVEPDHLKKATDDLVAKVLEGAPLAHCATKQMMAEGLSTAISWHQHSPASYLLPTTRMLDQRRCRRRIEGLPRPPQAELEGPIDDGVSRQDRRWCNLYQDRLGKRRLHICRHHRRLLAQSH